MMYFLDYNMKLCRMIEMYLKYDNMHTNVIINAFICIDNHVNSCIKCMLSGTTRERKRERLGSQHRESVRN